METISRRTLVGMLLGTTGLASIARARSAQAPAPAPPSPDVYRYLHLDVFTDRPLTGNQLAVFLDPGGLSAGVMQAIAREMSFSETTFVFPPERDTTDFKVRIFTETSELPFAGHPTIGSAFALAEAGRIAPDRTGVVFELGLGPTPLDLEWRDGRLAFAWMTQRPPTFGPTVADVGAVAVALGLDAAAVRSTGLPVQEVSCGSAFVFVPVAARASVDEVTIDRAAIERVFTAAGVASRGMFIFSTEKGADGADVYSRMISVRGFEDAATGSASGPLGCYLVHHGVVPPDRAGRIVSAQGVRMGRPSRIFIDIGTHGTEIVRVRVGGRSVVVGEGTVRPE